MRQSEIAAVIARDLLRADDGKKSNIECFSRGRGMTYKGSRFCGARCRQWFDDGNPGCGQGHRQRKASRNRLQVVGGGRG